MGLKLLTLFAFACFLTVAYLPKGVASDVSPSTRFELDLALKGLLPTKQKSDSDVSVVRLKVRKEIISALKPVIEKSKQLIQDINKNEEVAKARKKDISKCVKGAKVALKHLLKYGVNHCRKPNELKKVGHDVEMLGYSIRFLEISAEACSKETKNADACVRERIQKSSGIVNDLKNKISDQLKQVDPGKQGECCQRELPNLEKVLTSVETEWKECLKSSF